MIESRLSQQGRSVYVCVYTCMHVQVGASGEANSRGHHNQAACSISPESNGTGERCPGITPMKLSVQSSPSQRALFSPSIFISSVPLCLEPPLCRVSIRPGLGAASSMAAVTFLPSASGWSPSPCSLDLHSQTLHHGTLHLHFV